MERLGPEQRCIGQGIVIKTQFWGGVTEGCSISTRSTHGTVKHTSMLVVAVAVPATSGQAVGRLADEHTSVPAGNALPELGREVRAAVHDPTHALGPWGRREYARAQG